MPRSSRPSAPRPSIPLGSLTQPGARTGAGCEACGGERVTRLSMDLTDGTPVVFTSCHTCEHRGWTSVDGTPLPVDSVLERTRKRV